MKKLLFFISVFVVNIYPMSLDVYEMQGSAREIIQKLSNPYMPSTGSIEIYVKKAPVMRGILTSVTGKTPTDLLRIICSYEKLAKRVTKISFEPGLTVAITPCIGNLVNLESLILRSVVLKPYGEEQRRIPSEIGNLKKLRTLDLEQDGFFPQERHEIEGFFGDQNITIKF